MSYDVWNWVFFAFFVGGSLGGWSMLALFVMELVAFRREMKRVDEAERG